MLEAFAAWLASTPVTAFLQNHEWAVPAVQTLHILAIAVVVGGAAIANLRILGVVERDQPVSATLDRFLPWTLTAVLVLLATGLLLIASEPNRAIFRTVFWLKMGLVVAATAATWGQRFAFADHKAWDVGSPVPLPLRVLSVALLIAWIGVIFAGRWIGYVSGWPGAPG